jgi:hypothetical protein
MVTETGPIYMRNEQLEIKKRKERDKKGEWKHTEQKYGEGRKHKTHTWTYIVQGFQ